MIPSIGRKFVESYYRLSFFLRTLLSYFADYYEWIFHRCLERLGSIGQLLAALLIPDRLLRWFRRWQLTRQTQREERLEPTATARIVESLEHAFHHFTASIQRLVEPFGVRFLPRRFLVELDQRLTERWLDLCYRLGALVRHVADRIMPRWLVDRIGDIREGCEEVAWFAAGWTCSRNYRRLLLALPAVLLALPLATALVLSTTYSRTDKVMHYQASLYEAIQRNDIPSEALCVQKLQQMGYQKLERSEFQAAVALARDGDWQAAYQRMCAIAPEAEPGFPAAHAWIAGALAENFVEVEDRWNLVRRHAQYALALDSENALARRYLAEADLAAGNVDAAVVAMEEIAHRFDDLYAELMWLYLKSEVTGALAKRAARRAIVAFEQLEPTEGEVPLTARGFQRWCQAYELAGRDDGLQQALELGIRQFPDDIELQAMHNGMLTRHLAATAPGEPEFSELVRKLMESEDGNQVVLLTLARGLIREDTATESCVRQLHLQNQLPRKLYTVAGDFFAGMSRYQRALDYYRLACKFEPNAARAWNNVAWITSHVKPLRLEEALAAANQAVTLNPDPRYLETRGQIYCQMQRWEEASQDLENALNGSLPNSRPARRSLALAYERLGNWELTAAHRSMLPQTPVEFGVLK